MLSFRSINQQFDLHRWLLPLCGWFIVIAWLPRALAAEDRGKDRIWLIDTRSSLSSECEDCKLREVSVCEVATESSPQLTPSQLATQFSPQRTLLFFVHGNRIPPERAVERGLAVHQMLVKDSPAPFDLVLWSWPSAKIRRPLIDVREKAARTQREACLLSKFISTVDSRVRLRMIGYSFGSRIITGALHRLHRKKEKVQRDIRGVLLAAALSHDWLEPKRQHAGAMHQLDRMLLFVNPCDPVLRRFRVISGRGYALGYVGLPSDTKLGPLLKKVQSHDVQNEVGRSHSLLRYLDAPGITQLIRSHVFNGK